MSNYESHVLPALQQLSSSTSEPIRVAYVTAESVGKSTKLVPDLWKHVKATRADAQGLYILLDRGEATFASLVISSREAAVDIIDQVPDNQHELGLISCEYFNALMEDTADPSTLFRHQDMILFVDVEHIPTVHGDMSIGVIVDWIRGLKALQDVNLTVVFLAGNTREDIADVLDFHDIHPLHLAWEEAKNYEREELEDANEVVEAIRLALFESPQVGMAPCVVICSPMDEAYGRYVQPIDRSAGRDIRCLPLVNPVDMDYVADFVREDKPTVIFLGDSLAHYVPAIPNLRCVISFSHKRARIFDPLTSQFPMAGLPISEGDVFRQRAWASKAARADGDRPTFYTAWSDGWFQANKSKDGTHIKSDSMHLLLAAIKKFNSFAYPEVPVPALNGCSSLLGEVRRRLVIMGCLAKDAPTSQITPLGMRTLYYINHKTFNHTGNFHVAHLLARIETDPKLSIPSKRVLIRMTALTIYKNFYTLTDEAAQSLEEDDMTPLDVIIEDCAGIGKQNSYYGQLWCALGILAKMEAEKTAKHSLVNLETIVERGEGYMRVNVDACNKIEFYCRELEIHFGIVEACKDPIAETMLTQDESDHVFEVLARTYLFQVIYFPFDTALKPNDMISLRPVRLGASPELVDLTERRSTGDPEKFGFFAIYQESLTYGGDLAPTHLTVLPGGILQRIVDSFGAPNLSALVLTRYPVPTDEDV
ncbi:hypothetical protein F5Y00DRAFT_259111 [Daldinia vernicosa]|uniref:uncharacterized protein n=1 Tax=Daldinia vernicosa TaxID=114800 RepID=UPI0020075144|nr:uncharacterized protein F5Y00DRAFT_259111 [Daldinia vernicosa]KAI0852152.1 hypothetical protein F5Y00DRAFT_259111 [Daldinia vernicosa]